MSAQRAFAVTSSRVPRLSTRAVVDLITVLPRTHPIGQAIGIAEGELHFAVSETRKITGYPLRAQRVMIACHSFAERWTATRFAWQIVHFRHCETTKK